jgi:uncharacterized protein (TIGR00299 family) protein
MKVLRFDSVGGASGDMILGALVDLGVDVDELQRTVRGLSLGDVHIKAEPAGSHHLHGTKVTVVAEDEHHPHRGLAEIRALLERAELPGPVREQSLRVFQRIAEAEAEVHHTTPEKIHFHEVGAIDSIVDVVGACAAIGSLGVDAVEVGPLPLGCGTTKCAHGVYPVPVPATVLLLKDFPTVQTTEPHELVTPTGAALLSTWNHGRPAGTGRIARVGYGFGSRKLDGRPNALRATLLEVDDAGRGDGRDCLVLECQVDDTTPELMGSLSGQLLALGALDVFTTAVQMKKQRPGTLLTVLCRPEDRDGLLDLIFRGCTTFGVREHMTYRTMLDRRHETVSTPHGDVRIKIGRWQGEDVTFAPEMDDCIQLAGQKGVTVRVVYESAVAASNALRAGSWRSRD